MKHMNVPIEATARRPGVLSIKSAAAQPTPTRTLIVEDNFASRFVLQKLLSKLGECDIAVDGPEAVQAFRAALEAGQPYHLVCLDIMLPRINGHAVLAEMRFQESKRGIVSSAGTRIIMISALADMKNVMSAYRGLCDGYVAKPVKRVKLMKALEELRILEAVPA